MPEIVTDNWYGKSVFMTRPNWVAPPQPQSDSDLIDFSGIGRSLYHSYKERQTHLLTFEYMLEDREYISDMRAFFDGNRGRLEGFWIPSWRSDIVVNAVFGAMDNQISVEDFKYADFYLENDYEGRHICMIWPDGGYVFKKIITATNTLITISSATSRGISDDELSRFKVCFLYYVRFNSDELKLQFKNANFAITKLTFKSLFLSDEISPTATQTTTTSTVSSTSSTSSTASTSSTHSTTSSTISTTSTESTTSTQSTTSSTASTTSSSVSSTSTQSTTSTHSTTSSTVSTSSTISSTSSSSTSSTHSTTSSTISTTSTESTTSTQSSTSTTYTDYPGTDYYETDFREYTTGIQPGDWTRRWIDVGAADDYDVVTTNGELGGKALLANDGVTRYPFLSWDDVGSPETVEVICKFLINGDSYTEYPIVIRGSGTGDPATENGYALMVNTYDDEVELIKFTNGARSRPTLGIDVGYNMFGNVYHWARFRAIGARLQGKVWARDAEEPSWQFDYTDPSPITGGGWVGFMSGKYHDCYCDYFGVMLDRSDMPLRIYSTTTTTTTTA